MVAEPLTFYFDFTCPYSYLGWELMQKARRKRSFPMTLIGIGPNPPGNPNLLGRALWSDQRWSALQKLAEQLDITICKPAGKISSIRRSYFLPHSPVAFLRALHGRLRFSTLI